MGESEKRTVAEKAGFGRLDDLDTTRDRTALMILNEACERTDEAHPSETNGDPVGYAVIECSRIMTELNDQKKRELI